jgi:hypothetical protein
MATLTQTEFDYSLYKFKQNSSSGSFSVGDYDNIDLGFSSTSVVSFEDNLKEQNDINQSIWSEFEEVLRCVPKNELETLPSDAASEVDHYIYGTPKRK